MKYFYFINSFKELLKNYLFSKQLIFEIFLFTDKETGTKSSLLQVGEFLQDQDGFWPFESFYVETPKGTNQHTGRFRGFFTGYLLSEFLFYNLMILAIVVFIKLW